METELVVTILAGLILAAVSGVIGASWQAYRRRGRPLVVWLSFTGDEHAGDRLVDVDQAIVDLTRGSKYLVSLSRKSDFNQVEAIYNDCSVMKEDGPELLTALEEAVAALDTAAQPLDAMPAVVTVLRLAHFDRFIASYLIKANPSWKIDQGEDTPAVMSLYANDGFLIVSPPGMESFRIMVLDEFTGTEYTRDRFQPLVDGLSTLEPKQLRPILTDLAATLSREIEIAATVRSQLEAVVGELSRWGALLYLANYGQTALVILPGAQMIVTNASGRDEIVEECDIVVQSNEQRVIWRRPIIVEPNQSMTFSAVTKLDQQEMKRGNELRGRFNDGTSKVHIELNSVSTGRFTPSVRTADEAFIKASAAAPSKADEVRSL